MTRRKLTPFYAGLALLVPVLGAAANSVLQPFSATFAVEWRGMTAGNSTLELQQTGADTYTYTSRNLARGIFKIAIPDAVTQTSVFKVSNGKVIPMSYTLDDGSKDTSRDVRLQFDWTANRVTGTAEDKPVDAALKPGVQDALSVQIALICEVANGRSPTGFWLIDKDEVKEYQYARESTQTLDTPLGKVETIVYRSSRTGSDRVTRLWLAPSLGHLPIAAERKRGDRVDFSLKLRDLKRSPNT